MEWIFPTHHSDTRLKASPQVVSDVAALCLLDIIDVSPHMWYVTGSEAGLETPRIRHLASEL